MARRPSRILVPLDFSDCAPAVLAEARTLARALRAELLLLHVIAAPKGLSLDEVVTLRGAPRAPAREVLARDAAAQLDRLVASLPDDRVLVQTRCEEGPVSAVILRVAAEEQVRRIVMGTHGRVGYARTAFGSVAEDVIRKTTVPVTTVRTQHHAGCAARSCATCDADRSPIERAVLAELDR